MIKILFICHNGRGTDPVGAEYQRAADHQQQITEGIQSAEETHGGIGDAIDRSAGRITESQRTVQSARESVERTGEDLDQAGRILADCQRILDGRRSHRPGRKKEESLRIANESLAAYEKENNRTQKRLKAQRNLAYGIGTVLLVALVRK